MSDWNRTAFESLLVDSKDGEWGEGAPAGGLRESFIIRGTDFQDLNNPSADFPRRWIKDHLVDRKQLRPGDLILETAGGTSTQSTGRSVLLTQLFFKQHPALPVLCASFSRHLRLETSKYSPRFIYFLLQALYRTGYMAVFNIQHTGVSRFQYTAFKNHTELRVPELTVQNKIAAVLSAYEELIENNQRRIALLEKLAEEIYREWFVRFRFPGHENVKRRKGVPEGWSVSSLEDLIERKAASLQTGPFGTHLKASDYTEVGTPVINVRNIGMGRLVPEKLEYLSDAKVHRLSPHVLKRGDIVFGRKGAVERHLLVSEFEEGWVQGSDCIRLRLHDSYVTSGYLSMGFRQESHKEWMLNQCSFAATMASLNERILSRLTFLVPPQAIRVEFSRLIDPIFSQVTLLCSQTEKLIATRDLLLPGLTSGKLSVEDLEIQFPSGMAEEMNPEPRTAHA